MIHSQRWRQVLAAATAGALASAFAGSAAWAQAEEADVQALIEQKVDPDLLSEIDAEGEAELWVRFQGSPDFNPAFSADAKADKGTAAVDAAREFAETSQADLIAALDEAGVEYESYWATSTVKVTGGTELLETVAEIDEVDQVVQAPEYERIEPVDLGLEPAATEWGLDDIHAPDVWDLGYDGTGVTIASIDSGVDYDHPALVDQYRGNNGDGTFTHDYNFFDVQGACDGDPCDTDVDGHGTHTMGTMIGDDGGDNQIGVAPGAEWIAVNGCCPGLDALIESGEWIAAPTDAEGNDPDPTKAPDVVNNSWGTTQSVDDPFYEDIVALWHAAGIIPVTSLGNNGSSCESAGSPGLYPNVIGVGAYDVDGDIADFSARGPGRDGGVKPDIAAPGVNVRSSLPGGEYGAYSGTSMAAPHVVGMIALLMEAAPALLGDYDTVYEIVTGTARATADDQCGGTEDHNNVWGHGRIDALEAVLGSPAGETGSIAGTVTDAEGAPVEDAELVFEGELDRTATTGEDGTFEVPVALAGDYAVTVSKFGYGTVEDELSVVADLTTSYDAVLETVASSEVSGTIVDGSGHGWPLAATVSTAGGEASTQTDPVTGEYELTLPEGSWELIVEPDYPGYQTVTVEVVSAMDDVVEVPIAEGCVAPGYGFDPLGSGFESETAPPGWSVVNRGDQPWRFDDPDGQGNHTPGSGGFATADSDAQGSGGVLMDTDLISPTFDLSSADEPVLTFDTDYYQGSYDSEADVSVSVDGGETWEEAWASDGNARDTTLTVDLTEWADATEAKLKFHYTDNTDWAWWWQIDNVLVGTAAECAPLEGGLVLGTVSGLDTGDPLEDAVVTQTSTGYSGTTDADGRYWTFAGGAGDSEFSAVKSDFGAALETVDVVPDAVTEADFGIGTADITASSTTLNSYVQQGSSWTHRLRLTNSGSADGVVDLGIGEGSFSILGYENPSDTSWLSVESGTVTVPAGETITVEVTTSADEESGGVDQPGTYTATLSLDYESPNESPVVDVSMVVVPRSEQGKLLGSIEAVTCDGEIAALDEAQVQIREDAGGTEHLLSDEDGTYEFWFDEGAYTVIVSKDGYAADFAFIEVESGTTNEQDFELEELGC